MQRNDILSTLWQSTNLKVITENELPAILIVDESFWVYFFKEEMSKLLIVASQMWLFSSKLNVKNWWTFEGVTL